MKTGLSFTTTGVKLGVMLKTLILLLGMACASQAQVIVTNINLTTPNNFILIDKTLSSLSFAWLPNTETNIFGYNLYWGPAKGFYTNFALFRHDDNCTNGACKGTMFNISRTNRTWFALAAVNTALIESDLTTNELVYPAIIGTNYVVTLVYETAFKLNGPRTPVLIVTNRLVVTNSEFYIFTRSRIDRVP